MKLNCRQLLFDFVYLTLRLVYRILKGVSWPQAETSHITTAERLIQPAVE